MKNSTTARLLRETSLTVQFVGENKTIEALVEARKTPEALRKIDEINKIILKSVSEIYRIPIRDIKRPARGTIAVHARTACFIFQDRFLDYKRTEIAQQWEGVQGPNVSDYVTKFNKMRGNDAHEKKLLSLYSEADRAISQRVEKILSNG